MSTYPEEFKLLEERCEQLERELDIHTILLDTYKATSSEYRDEIERLKKGHFCPMPRLSKGADVCNCSHSDEHRKMDWGRIDKLQAENSKYRRALYNISGGSVGSDTKLSMMATASMAL